MAELITVEGEALTKAILGANTFKVSMSGMNTSKLAVEFKGSAMSKPQVMLQNGKDGNVTCTYTIKEPGDYEMCVTFDDDHVEGSPFKLAVA